MGRGNWEVVKRYKVPVIISTRDVMYNMINILNTAVCYIRKRIVRVSFTRKKFSFSFLLYLYEMMDSH